MRHYVHHARVNGTCLFSSAEKMDTSSLDICDRSLQQVIVSGVRSVQLSTTLVFGKNLKGRIWGLDFGITTGLEL